LRAGVCKKTGRSVAIKIYDKPGMRDVDLEHMRSEIEIHAGLSHHGVVKLEQVFESEDKVHVVMERLEGGEVLDRIIDGGRLPEVEVADVAFQVLETLAYLHAQGVSHRDIKPENILFEEKLGRKAKLIDFGYATRSDAGGKMSGRCGTLRYMSPEVACGHTYDDKADIWSVGSVVHAMLTAKSMFKGGDEEVRQQYKDGSWQQRRFLQGLSGQAQDFVLWLTSANADARPSACEALAHPWFHCLPAKLSTASGLEATAGTSAHQKNLRVESHVEALEARPLKLPGIDWRNAGSAVVCR
jgi:serine/threonine protein kinase